MKILSLNTSLPRLAPVDYIQSLIRSSAYIKDYDEHAKSIAFYLSKDFWKHLEGMDEEDAFETECNHRSELWQFRSRWPGLKIPISPLAGKKDPSKFISYLDQPVEVCGFIEPKDGLVSKDALLIGKYEGYFTGRKLNVNIDLSHSASEISRNIESIVLEYQKFVFEVAGRKKLAIPKPTSKRSKTKRKSKTQDMDPWKIYDVYNNAGRRDIKRTAELLFPKSFHYKKDKMEERAKVEMEYRKLLNDGTIRSSKEMNKYEKKLEMVTASSERIAERKRLKDLVRTTVAACREKIDSLSPSSSF